MITCKGYLTNEYSNARYLLHRELVRQELPYLLRELSQFRLIVAYLG